MNTELRSLAASLGISAPEARPLALAFGLLCARRVEHLLEEPGILVCLQALADFVAGASSDEALAQAAAEAARLAGGHRGSRSIDGCGHAAVSATYGVSKAIAGKALEAAEYCAYAAVYASGGYAAVADREAFEPEFEWQVSALRELARNGDRRVPWSAAEGDAPPRGREAPPGHGEGDRSPRLQ
jgi:hypothetical protein